MIIQDLSGLTSTLTSSSFLGFFALIGCGYFAHKLLFDPAFNGLFQAKLSSFEVVIDRRDSGKRK